MYWRRKPLACPAGVRRLYPFDSLALPMFRRLLKTFRSEPSAAVSAVNLVGTPRPEMLPAPKAIGIASSPQITPWTASRLDRIFRRNNAHPEDEQAQLEARHARHCLSMFWLVAPIDQLDVLYSGPIGSAYLSLIHI